MIPRHTPRFRSAALHQIGLPIRVLLAVPKTGSNRTQNAAEHFGELLVVLGLLMYSWFFVGFNYSQMSIFDFQTYCNTFCMISGTSKKSTKSGLSDPVFITKILQKYKKLWGHLWTMLFSYLSICIYYCL